MPHTMTPISQEMHRCAQECTTCYTTCLETVQHCLQLGGKHAEQRHIGTLLACAEICKASATVLSLGSEQHPNVCRACATLCRTCAEDCRRVDAQDDTMRRCADECIQCAERCEQMAAA